MTKPSAMIYQYAAVALLAASPVGEELVAIPLGIGLDLHPLGVAVTAVGFNVLPAVAISLVFARAERGTGPLRWLVRLRSQRVARILDRFGMPGVMVVTPWLGVYAVTTTLEALGMRRRRILGAIVASLILYAIALASGAHALFGYLL